MTRDMDHALFQAATLVDALPWLARFHDKIIVVKYGGNAMTSPELQAAFAEDVMFLRYAGLKPVIVHGGGPQITEHLNRLGIASEFRGGLRVTTPETVQIVRMVLTGHVNAEIVNMLNDHGTFAIGLSGEDASLLTAERRGAVVDGVEVDIGQVGDVVAVDPSAIHALIDAGRIPVIATVARGLDGLTYNVNADTAAAAIAVGAGRREADDPDRRRGPLRRLAAEHRGHQPDRRRDPGRAAAEPGQRHGPEDGGLRPRRRGRRPARPRARRPRPARPAARDLHQPGHRHDGRARPRTAPTEGTRMSASFDTRWDAVMMRNYGTPPLALDRGDGVRVWDTDGNAYLDFVGGIAVSSLGHAHPAIVAAVTEQVGRLAHTSNLAMHEPGVRLAERLVDLLGLPGPGVLRQQRRRGQRGRAQAGPAARPRHRPHRDRVLPRQLPRPHDGRARGHRQRRQARAVRAAARRRSPSSTTATSTRCGPRSARRPPPCIVEPTLGEGGVVAPPAGYLAAVRAACDDAGALLIVDEVQSGIGRTGHWFASQAEGVRPDVVTLAKGLGGGLPIGACLGIGAAGELFAPGDHGSTFGGNPVSCAAALAVLDTIADEGLLEHVEARRRAPRATGSRLCTARWSTDVRGSGLWRGARPHRRARPRGRGRRPRARPARQRRPARRASGWRPRWSSPRPRSTRPCRCSAAALDEVAGRMPRHFLRDDDLSPDELLQVLDLADRMKADRHRYRPLAGPQSVALLFDKPTLRTQLSFSVGVAELGGQPVLVDGRLAGIGVRESIADTTRVLSPAGLGHRLAHLRPGPHRGDGRGQPRCPSSTR